MRSQFGSLAADVDAAVVRALELAPRVAARDHTVWQTDPTEVADRLGWLDAVARADRDADELTAVAAGLVDDGVTDVVLVGMGGSSLYPEVLSTTFGGAVGRPRLHVLDSTDPGAVRDVEERVDWTHTAVVAASKSGTTVETRSHLARLTARLEEVHGEAAGSRLLAITDPGSELERLAREAGFRAVATGQPDVGGRFSALTPFGLLPAAILGLDVREHVAPAAAVLSAVGSTDRDGNPGAVLGAAIAAAVEHGRDKLTLLLPGEIAGFGSWIEQLVAESTGKSGTGVLPVTDEPLTELLQRRGDDRLVIALGEHEGVEQLVAQGMPVAQLPWAGPHQLAAEVARFEVATAFAGALLGINPFDQPDVQAAKIAATRALEGGEELPPTGAADEVLGDVAAGDYVALLAFVRPGSTDELAVVDAAARLRDQLEVPVTVGIGPRYLHSTGQLHKGGPASGRFLVVVGDTSDDLTIPGRTHTFGQLLRAQAAGDIAALRDAGRPVVRVGVEDLASLGT
jgi:transaldolase/glucose-6-phosphate isomerase